MQRSALLSPNPSDKPILGGIPLHRTLAGRAGRMRGLFLLYVPGFPVLSDAYGVATDLEGAMSIGVFWGDTLALLPCPTLTFSTLGGLAIFICSQIPLITASCTCFTASPAVLRSRTGGRPDGPRSSHLTSVREKLRIPQAGSPQPSVSPYHAV